MADQDKIETRYNYFWIHQVFGHFVQDTMEYFKSYLYPRFGDWAIIGTFDKAVEFINKKNQHGRETDMPLKPALILDPSGDLNLDETYGKQPWRFPNLAPGFVKYVFEPIYQDQNVLITVAFSRFVGEFNFTALLSSFYEYTDMRVFLNLIFGGTDRIIYPRWFNSFIILPSEIFNYRYENEYTGMSYKINIEESSSRLIETTNTNEVVFPCSILPRYKMTSVSDASTRLGGVENLPDWKLNFTLSYEVELPTFIVLETDYLVEKFTINMMYESCYTSNKVYDTSEIVPANIESFDGNLDFGLDSTSNSIVTYPEEAVIDNIKSRLVKTRYYHIVTQEEVDSTTYVDITIPEEVNDINLLRMNGKYGNLVYGDNYIILNGTIIRINKEHVNLELHDILEIFIYEYI